MHVVTFYSYKGGVGRTMALVNSACLLANAGKNVLVVDFDLEAPGLPSFDMFMPSAKHVGVVDFVGSYLQTGQAPDVQDYIVRCPLLSSPGKSISIMSAGRQDHTYSARYASIDWKALYRDHEGFLLFEDMRQQWEESAERFDYVLVDSRTGHTDTGGICTRQLPNVVVLMFYPNAQNIDGLTMTANEIRFGGEETGRQPQLLFCPSNVPYLDDDEDVLSNQLKVARQALGFTRPAATIHHYGSLDLLKQHVFVNDRPRSRLAREYQNLVAEIVKTNLEDKQGALSAIADIRSKLRQEAMSADGIIYRSDEDMHDASFRTISGRIDTIQRVHSRDPEVALALAEVYRIFGNLQSEYDALTIAITYNEVVPNIQKLVPKALRRRAFNLFSRRKPKEASTDLLAVLASDDAVAIDISAAVRLLSEIDQRWIENCNDLRFVDRLDWTDQIEIVELLKTTKEGTNLAVSILRKAIEGQLSDIARKSLRRELELSLIAIGEFEEALVTGFVDRKEALASSEIAELFNYAMADWGAKGRPPLDLFERVITLDGGPSKGRGANYNQCLAVASGALGLIDQAQTFLRNARAELGPGQVFSCWRYLLVSRDEMLLDLDLLEKGLRSRKLVPKFLEKVRRDSRVLQ